MTSSKASFWRISVTEWFDKKAGSEIVQSQDDPTMLLIGADLPDWVRVPAKTGHGGQYRCLAVIQKPCPLPGHGEPCKHYILDGPVHAAECAVSGQFAWYRRQE